MKLIIFGATGRAGKPLVELALTAGYDITAFVRTPSKFTASHERLRVVQGDVTDPLAVERAIQGADVVISVMATSGSRKVARSKPLTCGTHNIINAMNQHGVTRLIVSAANTIPHPNDSPDIRFKLLRVLVRFLAPASYADTVGSVNVVRGSGLDWTIVRMGRASDDPARGTRAGYVSNELGIRITGADAAAFMLNEVLERKYIHQAPVICSR
jgi:nucleoside-diphosphate-sugar epimerase